MKQKILLLLVNSVKIQDAKITSCVLPVNHNISVMGY